MKILSIAGVILTCCLLHSSSSAQDNSSAQEVPPVHQTVPVKPALFNNLPDTFNARIFLLKQLFDSPSRESIVMHLYFEKFSKAKIIERVQQSANVASVNIRLFDYDNALLTVSKIIQSDSSVTYVGRIMHIKYADAFVLHKENDQYYFIKEKLSFMVVE